MSEKKTMSRIGGASRNPIITLGLTVNANE